MVHDCVTSYGLHLSETPLLLSPVYNMTSQSNSREKVLGISYLVQINGGYPRNSR